MATFGERLKYLRTRQGMSQAIMADILSAISPNKVSRSTIGMWESGRNMPSRESLEALADHFNVPMDYLLGRVDDPTSSGLPSYPEIAEIAQASRFMTEQQRDLLLRWAKLTFPEAFLKAALENAQQKARTEGITEDLS